MTQPDHDAVLRALHEKVEQLALSSRYKSEFLANLSHELRTPLNSLLILGQLLAENATGNLTPQQVEYAQTICMAGDDLLELTNEILDLAKVESGTVSLSLAHGRLADLRDYVERSFRQIARDKGLEFTVSMHEGLPATIRTDLKRLRQILQNLLSNAFKFTPQGSVSFEISLAGRGWTRRRTDADKVLKFSVADTGIGIANDKQQVIFEAFRQADGTTDRRFGGTGLGLAISADLARLLGGEIRVESGPGKGSTFALFLPLNHELEAQTAPPPDDRGSLRPGERVVLVVAEDAALGALLVDRVHALGLKTLSAANAHTVLALANEFMPSAAVVGVTPTAEDGWASFGLLRQDPDTRHIPVGVVCIDEQAQTFVGMGMLGFLGGASRSHVLRECLRRLGLFTGREVRTVLIADAGKAQRQEMVSALAGDGLHASGAATGKQALKVLAKPGIDCTVVGQSLSGMRPLELVRQVIQSAGGERMSIVMQRTVDPETGADRGEVNELAEMLVLRREKSAAAVLEHAARCLNESMAGSPVVRARPPPANRKALARLANTKVLIVDDEIRDVFALTSALEQHGMRVSSAASGPEGIESLKKNPDTAIILMDMMMPGLDGYQTIRHVRRLQRFANLPIIGVTAGAMKGDREKCIAAGASDYVAKPVDLEQLLSVMGMWLAEQPAAGQPGSAQTCTSPASMA
jgi:CheY-like chemotaxis protein/nitrogen-specific signal transduction histidine kinase